MMERGGGACSVDLLLAKPLTDQNEDDTKQAFLSREMLPFPLILVVKKYSAAYSWDSLLCAGCDAFWVFILPPGAV